MSGHPHAGQIVYGKNDGTDPWLVLGHDGTSILMVPVGTDWRRTHKGNVYNGKGVREWME